MPVSKPEVSPSGKFPAVLDQSMNDRPRPDKMKIRSEHHLSLLLCT